MWLTDYRTQQTRGIPEDQMSTMCYCNHGTESDVWEEVRYKIELDKKMVADPFEFEHAVQHHIKFKTNATTSVAAIRASDIKKPVSQQFVLGDDTSLSRLDEIVLYFTMPNGKSAKGSSKINFYIPLRARSNLDRQAQQRKIAEFERELSQIPMEMGRLQPTENELRRLEQIKKITRLHFEQDPAVVHRLKRAKEHPLRETLMERYRGELDPEGNEVKWEDIPKPVPEDDTYVCQRCYNYFAPHYVKDCPSHHIAEWIPMRDRPLPHGRLPRELQVIPWDAPVEVITAARHLDKENRPVMPKPDFAALMVRLKLKLGCDNCFHPQ